MDALEKRDALPKKSPGGLYGRAVKLWLLIGLVMIFCQIVIGGVTRLTGSGLSITKWEIVTGTLPPMNAGQWEEAFEMYKKTPQYQKINEGMTMSEFRFIYFWEYIHRLWARLMGVVFAVPFIIFWRKGLLDSRLMRRLGVVVLLAALVASFGWIMVASGLVDRPWVNAYKLTIHLSLAILLFSYLLWTTFEVFQLSPKVIHNDMLKKGAYAITALLAVQIILGGIMSGMKAALFYPTWPDMNGAILPAVLLDGSQWNVDNFVNYDSSPFMSALVQTLHRTMAYTLTIIVLWYFFVALKVKKNIPFRVGIYLLITMLIIQICLGIFTLIHSIGIIPVGLGVFHQAFAILLLSSSLFVTYQTRSAIGK
jgi:heme a synthase